MGIIEAVKKGFGIASKGMGLVLVLFGFNLVGNLASLPFTPAPGAAAEASAAVPLLIVSFIFIIISIFVQGGTLGLVKDALKEGKMKLGSMVQYGAKYFVRLLVLGIVILLTVIIVALVAGLIVALTAPLNNNVITALAIIIASAIVIATALYFFIPFALSPYAVVCDEMDAIASLKKSIEVARKPFVKVFSLLLLIVVLVLIALGVGFVIGLVVGLLSAILPAAAARILMLVVSSAVNGYLGVVATTAFMAYYLSAKQVTAKL